MVKTVSILGLGWLGLPLAKSLLAKGYRVKGTVTSLDKLAKIEYLGIAVSVLNLFNDELVCSDNEFFDTDILVINFPPKRVENIETLYPNQVSQLLPFLEKYSIQKVIFISSTSVYPEVNGMLTEENAYVPEKPSGVACLNAENVLRNDQNILTTVIRFGGLIGADRNPHSFMKRGIRKASGEKPVNLIHLDDCIGIIEHVIKNEIWDNVLNACCPVHPSRAEFYKMAAKVAGVNAPQFETQKPFTFKEVNSDKLVKKLSYTFIFQNPIEYLNSL